MTGPTRQSNPNKVGAMFVKERNDGKGEYFFIVLNDVPYTAYANEFKKDAKSPDFVIYKVDAQPRTEYKQQAAPKKSWRQ
jgi:hypothetical protein